MSNSTDNNSIIVEDLNASINVTVLKRHFSVAGTVAKVDVLRDPVTSRPTGTAVVTFKVSATADFAVANLNGSMIFGRPCRVSHIPDGAYPVELVEKPVQVPSMPVVPEVSTLSGVGQQGPADAEDTLQLSFDSHEMELLRAADCIAADGSVRLTPEVMAAMVADRQGRVVESTNSEKPVSVEMPASKSLYIRNISTDTTEDTLRAMFCRYGPIVSVRLKMSKWVRGGVYVILKYEDVQHAAQAVAELNGWKQVSGEPLMVKLNLPRSVRRSMKPKRVVAPRLRRNVPVVQRVPVVAEKPACKTVYIRNVPPDMTDDALRVIFASAGPVIGLQLKQSKRVSGRMYAFVKYEGAEHAAQAVADLNGWKQDSGEPLMVKLNRRMKAKRRVARQAAVVSGGSSVETENYMPVSSSTSAQAEVDFDLQKGTEVSGGDGSTQPGLKAAMVELASIATSANAGQGQEVVAA